jgi:hypothetical protein
MFRHGGKAQVGQQLSVWAELEHSSQVPKVPWITASSVDLTAYTLSCAVARHAETQRTKSAVHEALQRRAGHGPGASFSVKLGASVCDVPEYPCGELVTLHSSRRNQQDYLLLLIDSRRKLAPVQHQDYFHRCVTDALVAVYEGMIANEEVAERRGLLFD